MKVGRTWGRGAGEGDKRSGFLGKMKVITRENMDENGYVPFFHEGVGRHAKLVSFFY